MGNSYIVYKHTTPDGRVYIGATNQTAIHRWGLNGNKYANQPFGRAIESFGWDNIRHEVLHTDLTKEEAESIEKTLISQYKARDPAYGYNRHEGGNIAVFSAETKDKISKALTGRKLTSEHKEHIANGGRGRFFSEETRRKIGDAHRNKVATPETIELLKASHQWQAKPVAQYTMDGRHVADYRSTGEAARAVGVEKVCIRQACNGKIKASRGYLWRYIEGGEDGE